MTLIDPVFALDNSSETLPYPGYPWVRVHLQADGEQLGISPVSMLITATVADWEDWTGLRFPESGPYVVPGALQPVTIDTEGDLGRHDEPNIWMLHRP